MSSKFKEITKGGWHPEKPGQNFKKQVTGMFGKDKGGEESQHVARPLSSLRDPASFAPPPKRVAGGSIPASPAQSPAPASSYQPAAPSRPSAQPYQHPQSTASYQQQPESEPEAEDEPPPPPRPFRVDTTGLSTAGLPPPPAHRDRRVVPGQASSPSPPAGAPPPYSAARPQPPSLPPRLPPRSTATSPPPPTRPPVSETQSQGGLLNQGAINRLGAAGVSVPGLGIGKSPSPAPPARHNAPSPSSNNAQLSELQTRFSKLGTSTGNSETAPPSQGTTWAQKQAALNTASNFRKDPSSVSVSDARSAASTLNNFRQRHGDQVTAGVQSANSLNQKYGVTDRLNSYGAGGSVDNRPPSSSSATPSTPGLSAAASVLGKKKPAPPPPKKKPALSSPVGTTPTESDGAPPPPVPMSTRPQF